VLQSSQVPGSQLIAHKEGEANMKASLQILLNIICGLDEPNRGHVLIDSENLVAMSENELARLRLQAAPFSASSSPMRYCTIWPPACPLNSAAIPRPLRREGRSRDVGTARGRVNA
jgi:predicted ABC-type transport system involved in lysophospholipase L1 biosynthesis ATPase subunit